MTPDALSLTIKACRKCRDNPAGPVLPHEPNPVCVLSSTARICIAGQAPGIRVHRSGRPFTDPSGDRLRSWMGIDETVFYDDTKISIVPMGFCFPGHDKKGGDLPPRKECCTLWHDKIFASMPQVELILTIGRYAQAYHLGSARKANMTDTVSAWREYLTGGKPGILPMPHPSWRNNSWLKRHEWFEAELLPVLRKRVQELL